VVIHDFDLGRVAVGPLEDHPPLVVDPDRIEAFEISLQFLQTIRGRYREIAYSARRVDRFELALGATGNALKVTVAPRFACRRRTESPTHYTAHRDAVKDAD